MISCDGSFAFRLGDSVIVRLSSRGVSRMYFPICGRVRYRWRDTLQGRCYGVEVDVIHSGDKPTVFFRESELCAAPSLLVASRYRAPDDGKSSIPPCGVGSWRFPTPISFYARDGIGVVVANVDGLKRVKMG